jgi:hypothetical protein
LSVSYATGNDEAAWDLRFTGGEWEAVQGDLLTTRFGECILDRMPAEVTDLCGMTGARLLDWGCARGQFVDMLRKRFPDAGVVDGIDHSSAGVYQAKELYGEPGQSGFYWDPNGWIHGRYDVIFNSNVMEHLVDPIAKLREHLSACYGYYVILTPYEEPLGEERREHMTPEQRHAEGHTHVQQFHLGDFPQQLEGFVRIAQIHDIEPGEVWPGYQLLVVYKRA